MSFKRRYNRRAGSTLVEILVAMVILAVGIMTVVRLFPVGFGIITGAENRTVATKLAQKGAEQWKTMAASLPSAIVPIDDNGDILSNQLSGPPFEGVVEDGNSFYRGNVLNYRNVLEEKVKVPSGSYFSTGSGEVYGSRYTLFFSPVDIIRDGNTLINFFVKSGELSYVVGDHNGRVPSLKSNQYAIDYVSDADADVFYMAFPKSDVRRTYYVTYSYRTQDKLDTDVNYPVHVGVNDGGTWLEIKMPNGALSFEEGTQVCQMAFREINGNWSDDPYEFIVADDLLGIVAFNPAAQGMTALIDYEIKDPRIIREDFVPDGNEDDETLTVNLSLKFLLDAGEPNDFEDGTPTDNPDEPTFEGLIRSDYTQAVSRNNMIISDSVMAVDLETGYRLVIDNSWIDYKAGIIYLPREVTLTDWETSDTQTVETAGRNIRFYYRADGDWTVQMQKAPSVFYCDYGNRNGSEDLDYRHYAVYDDALQLVFAPCNNEFTVSVDYSYYDSQNVEHKVVGESAKIDKDSDNGDDFHIDLRCNDEGNVRLGTIYSVTGTSFKSRVIWRDGKHWRNSDIDTILTRTAEDEDNR